MRHFFGAVPARYNNGVRRPMNVSSRVIGVVLGGALLDTAVTWFVGRLPLTLLMRGWPNWLLDVTFVPLGLVSSISVGIAIGWAARRHSFWIGAAAFAFGHVLFRTLDRLLFSPGVWGPIEPMWFTQSLVVDALSGGIFGLAGEYLRTKRSSRATAAGPLYVSRNTAARVVIASVAYTIITYFSTRLPEHVQFDINNLGVLEWTYLWFRGFSHMAVGLTIGWYSQSDGARIGAISFGLGDAMFSVLDHVLVTPYASIYLMRILQGVAASSLLGAAYGLAGEYMRNTRSSNKRLQATCETHAPEA